MHYYFYSIIVDENFNLYATPIVDHTHGLITFKLLPTPLYY